jgi:hypothetical protein
VSVDRVTRRLFVASGALAARLPSLHAAQRKPRVACILNAYFPNSHADVFVSRLLDGYRLNHAWHDPRLEVVSFYVDQFPPNDLAREQADEHGIKIYPSVTEALRLGGSRIAVDAVAVIGEHGDYPRNSRGNFMYPRWRYFDEITRLMREENRILPMYQDKYFAYEWADVRRTSDRIREMKIPFLCGSTVPLSWQRPPLQLPATVHYSELLTTSYSDIEEHAYHGIELLQSMAERRAGGETGVASVRWCRGEEVWDLAAHGEWSRDLLDSAFALRVNPVPPGITDLPEAFLIRYRDGLRGTVLHLNGTTRDYLFAARLKDRQAPIATCFYIQLNLHNHWSFMVRNFEDLVLTRREPNPIERTLIANGIMLAGLESRLRKGTWVDTPELAISYSSSP